jgi:hypothetical protein
MALELWNFNLQEKVQKLKTKNINEHELSKKVDYFAAREGATCVIREEVLLEYFLLKTQLNKRLQQSYFIGFEYLLISRLFKMSSHISND